MIAQDYYIKDFEAHVIVAQTVERMAELMAASVTHEQVDWRLDCQTILSLSKNVSTQARLLKEHGLLRMAS